MAQTKTYPYILICRRLCEGILSYNDVVHSDKVAEMVDSKIQNIA